MKTNKERIKQLEKEMFHLKSLVKLQEEKEIDGIEINWDSLADDTCKNKPEFKEGWYINKWVSPFIGYWSGNKYIYGIGSSGGWFDEKNGVCRSCEDKLATNKEVETALIKEAIKRGFKEGITAICTATGDHETIHEMEFEFFIEPDDSWMCVKSKDSCTGKTFLFNNGIWATITEDKLIIHGEEIKQTHDRVIFGCARFNKKSIIDLHKTIKTFNSQLDFETGEQPNRKIVSIKIDTGEEVTIDQLKEICDNIK